MDSIEPHIHKKYQNIKRIHTGAYAVTFKAVETDTNQPVLLKKYFDVFQNQTDAQRFYREVMIRHKLEGHPNVVKYIRLHESENLKDLYLVQETTHTNLHKLYTSTTLEDHQKVSIIYQILKGLKYLHSAGVVHRDLRPCAILVDSDLNPKIDNFCMARCLESEGEQAEAVAMTEYTGTRWYRAPEAVLGSNSYSKQIDMWAVGCLFGELVKGKPVFRGASTIAQITEIIKLLGKPTTEDLEAMKSTIAGNIVNVISQEREYSINQSFNFSSENGIDFLRRTLVYIPQERLTVEQALKHPLFAELHDPENEIASQGVLVLPLPDSEKKEIEVYQGAIMSLISENDDVQGSSAELGS